MPRGRPRKIPLVEEDKKENKPRDIIAQGIENDCDIPGCQVRFHLDVADEIIKSLDLGGYLIQSKGEELVG